MSELDNLRKKFVSHNNVPVTSIRVSLPEFENLVSEINTDMVCPAIMFRSNPQVILIGSEYWDKHMKSQYNAFKTSYLLCNDENPVLGFINKSGEFIELEGAN